MLSIKSALNIRLAVIQFIVITVFALVTYFFVKSKLVAEFDKHLETFSQAVSGVVKIEYEDGGVEIELEYERAPVMDFKTTIYYVATPKGKVIFNPAKVDLDGVWAAPSIPESGFVTGRTTLPDGRNARFLARNFSPIVDDGGVYQGDAWSVVVVQECSVIDDTLNTILIVGCGIGILAILVSLIANYLSIRRGLKPLDEISAEVAELDSSDLSRRFSSLTIPSELEPITSMLDELLERMQLAFHREQRFTSSAAHELRTPLAELKAILQFGKGVKAEEDSVESIAQIFSDGNEVVKRMSRLLETLFQLSRNSVQRADLELSESPTPSQHRLDKIIDLCIVGADGGARVNVVSSGGYAVLIDEDVLISVINNLLSNALAHGKGLVGVEIDGGAHSASFTIWNDAPGLTDDDLEKLREPFWRKQKSRSDQKHLGLGLNLVEMYCSSQGWELSLKLDANKFYVSVTNIPTS